MKNTRGKIPSGLMTLLAIAAMERQTEAANTSMIETLSGSSPRRHWSLRTVPVQYNKAQENARRVAQKERNK